MSSIKINISFNDGGYVKWIYGTEVPYERLTVGDLTDRIAETEAHLSRITGLEVKIETGAE
jgi:hypothetical protein